MTASTTKSHFKQQLSHFLRRYPWIVRTAYSGWRLFQAKYTVGAVGVVLNTQGQILLVEHVLHPKHPWGLPGGWVDHQEDPAEAVRREIQEELALNVEVGPIISMELPYKHNHIDLAYLCHTNATTVEVHTYELMDARWFSPDELPLLSNFNTRAIEHALAFTKEQIAWH